MLIMPSFKKSSIVEQFQGNYFKRNHEYYTQVQGQMGVSGASWCDLIVYTKKGTSVERIALMLLTGHV